MAKSAYDMIKRHEDDELVARVVRRMSDGASLTTPETARRWAKERTAARKVLKQRLAKAKTDEEHNRLHAQLETITTPTDREREKPLAVRLESKVPTAVGRDLARMILHGFARTGSMALKTLDIPNRIFGSSRSVLRDMYDEIDENLARDRYEVPVGIQPVGETAVSLATAGAFGKALPAVFGANVGVDTYETARATGASRGEAAAKGIGHGVLDTAVWTLGQGLSSRFLPESWQWLGREITGAMRGASSSVLSDAMLNSFGADIPPEEMAKRAAHAAWMVPLLGMLKMGGKRREEAETLLRKARPELAGKKTGEVIEMIEKEFLDPKSQKVAVMWVARKGANLPDDTAQMKQALEVAGKVKGLDPMSMSPYEILSNPKFARYLPKPKPQDVKAFTNMKRYPEGVVGFDVSDDAAGRQATREMINAYLSPTANPWCLASGAGASKVGELGPAAEMYWKGHSAVPKQIFFQQGENGKLELTAFRATSPGGEGRAEYWDVNDASYDGVPLKQKIPGDPLGRYRLMVFRPEKTSSPNETITSVDRWGQTRTMSRTEAVRELNSLEDDLNDPGADHDETRRRINQIQYELDKGLHNVVSPDDETVQGKFEDATPGRIYKGSKFADGKSQVWVGRESDSLKAARDQLDEYSRLEREDPADPTWHTEAESLRQTIKNLEGRTSYVLAEETERTTKDGISTLVTKRYASPEDWDYEAPKPGETPQPVEVVESKVVNPELMRQMGYDPDSQVDTQRFSNEVYVQDGGSWAAPMATIPTAIAKPGRGGRFETVNYDSRGKHVASVEFTGRDGRRYRTEYFDSGPEGEDPSGIYDLMSVDPTAQIGPMNQFALPQTPSGSRIVDITDAEPKTVEEVKWDETLKGFVGTRGNRRWRTFRQEETHFDKEGRVLDEEGWRLQKAFQDAVEDYMFADIRYAEDGGVAPEDKTFELQAAVDDAEAAWSDWAKAHNVPTSPPAAGIIDGDIIEETIQPDGTWTPAPPAAVTPPDAGSSIQLPPPPPEVPIVLKAGDARGDVHAAAKGGDVAPDADPAVSDKPPVEEREPSPEPSAPARIIINPRVFKDNRDGLCVAYNEAFRIIMAENGFDPQAEPTEEQRKFFSDTAYADDERMLRRTILARICTFDDSVKNPTDEQLDEALEFLETVMEIGAPQSEEEQANVQRIHDMIAEVRKAPRPEEQPAEQPVESEAPPVAAVGGGYSSSEERWADRRAGIGTMQSRDENGRLSGSNWMRDENGRLPGSATEARASEEARAEGDNLKEGLKFDNPKDKAFGGEVFPGDPAAPLGVDEDGGEAEIPGLAGDAPMAQAGAAAPAENPGVTLGRRADGSLAEGSLRDQRDENGRLIRADGMGGKTGAPRGSAKTDDTYVTNTAVVMPEAEARKMGVVTQGFEHVGRDQVAIPFEDFRPNGTVVDAAELLAESYGSKEAAEAAVAKSMANRAKRYPGGVPSEAAMSDPESVPVVPAGARPGPWDEAYLSHAARAGHWNLKTVKSGAYLRTAGYIPGLSLGLIPTRVLGTSSPSIEVRRMLNSQVGETGESAGNGRIVTISDTANPNKPGWYASDEGYRAAALGSVKGWLTANGRMPGEGEDLAAVMAAAHRDRAGLKRGKIDKNGKDFLAAVAKAYEAERGGSASKKDKEILAAARDMDMWEQVVGARRYDRYSTTA